MITEIIDFIQLHPEYGMIIAFALAMIESLPLIGSFVPGLLTMPPIGWLIATSALPATETLSLILLGAMIGDYIGYLIGIHCKKRVQETAAYYNKSNWLDIGENFVSQYGQYSIIIGRFIGPLRSSIPLFAGILNMKKTHFILAAITSVILWAVIHLAPGFMLAWFNWDILNANNFPILCYGITMCLLLIINAYRNHLAYTIRKNLITHNLAPNPPEHLAEWIQIFCYGSTLTITTAAVISKKLSPLNHWVLQSLYTYHHTTGLSAALTLSNLAETMNISLLCALIIAWLVWQRQYLHAQRLATTFSLTFILVTALKFITSIPRPAFIAHVLSQQAFPSGHTALALCLVLSLNTIMAKKRSTNILGWAFILAIPCTRLYLGAHWLTDILGACFIALFCYAITPSIIRLTAARLPLHLENDTTTNITQTILRIIVVYCIVITLIAYLSGQLSPTIYQYVPSTLS